MELLVASDLHYGVSAEGDRAVEALARHVAGAEASALLLGGDLASDAATLDACLGLFAGFAGPKLAVPGNHDVWITGPEASDSLALHDELLPRVFERHGFHPLHARPYVLGDVGFVGSMGWYDYSFRDDIGIDLAAYRAKTLPGATDPLWNDAHHTRFPLDDEALTELLLGRLEQQLAEASGCRAVVALLHHVATKGLLYHPRVLVPRLWRFANAFLGSERFAELLERAPNVALVFCGHIHRSRTAERGGRTYVSIGGDYERKELVRATPWKVLERRMFSAP